MVEVGISRRGGAAPYPHSSFAWTVSESIGYPDIGECYIARGAGVFEEASGNKPGQIYCDGSVQIERPSQFKVRLAAYIPRSASIARSHQRASDLIDTVIEAFAQEPA